VKKGSGADHLEETLVVDCSVAAKWVLQESGRIEALHLLDEQESGKTLLLAPDLLLTEFAGLIAKRTRRNQMPVAQAHQAFRLMEESELRLFDTRPLLGRALDLVLKNQMSFWDCVYLALAIQQECPMITADRRLFRGGVGRHPAIRLLN
jgi:predicted nucleic acid-binding protein